MILRRRARTLAFSALLLALPTHAFAQDAAAVGARIKDAMAQQGVTVNWSNIAQNGSQIVLQGVTVAVPNEPASPPIGDVTLDDVSDSNGALKIGMVTFPSFAKTEDGTSVSLSGAMIDGLTLPPAGAADAMAFPTYDSAKLDSVSVKQDDKQLFGLNNLHFEMTPPAGGQAMQFTGAADSFSVDLSSVPDPQSKAVLDALGYSKLDGVLKIAGSWQPTDGQLALSQYDIAVKDVGTLGFTFNFGGYTPAFIKSLKDMQAKMAAQPAGADNSTQGIAMLGLMQQLTLNSVSIRFDDDSLTDRVLNFYAKQQNVSVNDLKNQVKALLPFMSSQLNNPDLNKQIVTAVNAFIDKPGSIEVKATPPAPVPFAQLAAGGMTNPIELTNTLGLSITANQGSKQ